VEKTYPKAKELFVNYLKMPEKFTIFQLKLALSNISVRYNEYLITKANNPDQTIILTYQTSIFKLSSYIDQDLNDLKQEIEKEKVQKIVPLENREEFKEIGKSLYLILISFNWQNES